MSLKLVVTSLLFLGLINLGNFQETCELDNESKGVCKLFTECPGAFDQLKKQIKPKICSFQDLQPIVCCAQEDKRSDLRKSEQKCVEYSKLKFGVERDEDPLITGGEDAVPKEFPHMAILGYGNENSTEWKCGGTLISEQFVLTAAHCLYSSEFGDVKFVRLGDLDIYSTKDVADPQQYKISKTIPYQEYTSTSHYHDIALLKLEKPVKFSDFVRPACIQTKYSFENVTLKATGWGALSFGSDIHSFLQKVNLHVYAKKDCDVTYKPAFNLLRGIADDTQICAGSFVGGRDTCQGDSGGPLQRIIQSNPIVYKVVGIVSVGKYCGLVPGLYTRVSAYVTWIEDNVWNQ
ncbi:venom protease-like [Onthophagus taurus]|uniref:venom protease-like n=1 Tax=Onthophagus taurus TaxID=166361 RepID=UPI0039BDDFFA